MCWAGRVVPILLYFMREGEWVCLVLFICFKRKHVKKLRQKEIHVYFSIYSLIVSFYTILAYFKSLTSELITKKRINQAKFKVCNI